MNGKGKGKGTKVRVGKRKMKGGVVEGEEG